jgi:hypothetical protein
VGELLVAAFIGFFALLAVGAAAAQLHGFTGRRQRSKAESRNCPPR